MSNYAALALAISEAYGSIDDQPLSSLFMEKFADMAKLLREIDESIDFTDYEAECMESGITIAEDLLHSANFAVDRVTAVPQPDQSTMSVEQLIDRILTCAKALHAELS